MLHPILFFSNLFFNLIIEKSYLLILFYFNTDCPFDRPPPYPMYKKLCEKFVHKNELNTVKKFERSSVLAVYEEPPPPPRYGLKNIHLVEQLLGVQFLLQTWAGHIQKP